MGLVFSEGGLGTAGIRMLRCSEVITGLGSEAARTMHGGVVHNDGTEALLGALHRSILEGEVSDVVLVNHAEDWFLLNLMNFGLLIEVLVHRFEFPESVVADQLRSYLLRFAVVHTERHRQSTRSQTV